MATARSASRTLLRSLLFLGDWSEMERPHKRIDEVENRNFSTHVTYFSGNRQLLPIVWAQVSREQIAKVIADPAKRSHYSCGCKHIVSLELHHRPDDDACRQQYALQDWKLRRQIRFNAFACFIAGPSFANPQGLMPSSLHRQSKPRRCDLTSSLSIRACSTLARLLLDMISENLVVSITLPHWAEPDLTTKG